MDYSSNVPVESESEKQNYARVNALKFVSFWIQIFRAAMMVSIVIVIRQTEAWRGRAGTGGVSFYCLYNGGVYFILSTLNNSWNGERIIPRMLLFEGSICDIISLPSQNLLKKISMAIVQTSRFNLENGNVDVRGTFAREFNYFSTKKHPPPSNYSK